MSAWRLESLIRHRATTYPTFDPTWYAPMSIVLGALEVDTASICASAPVFWPVLRAQVTKIFVTQEIEIIREDRNLSDEFEMHRTWSGISGREGPPSLHSHQGSEVGLKIEQVVDRATSTKQHYQDRYIRDQVDPFSKITSNDGKAAGGVASQIRSDSIP